MATDSELAHFVIRDVEGIEESAEREEKHVGVGSYGYVFKVKVRGVERIAKKLHSAFVNQSEVSSRERQGITSRFRNECVILSKLRHPNIVQFIGVHYGKLGKDDLTLIMEYVSSDMDKFLATHPNIPLPLKLSILLDVSYGLVYLHECNPPIVHRDLTARNVLITDKCQAKIADLGMAKVVDIQAQLAASHTQTPGQMFYMPPEALKERASCTPKLDIFSFGHLALYTVNQELPKVYQVTLTVDIQRQGIIERLRRMKSLDLAGEDHCLYPIITDCLFDYPEQRPTTRVLNNRLSSLSTENPAGLENILELVAIKENAECKKVGCKEAVRDLEHLRRRVLQLEDDKKQANEAAKEQDLQEARDEAKLWKGIVDDQQKVITDLEDTKKMYKAELSHHVLSKIEEVEPFKALGTGAYGGHVSLVRVNGVKCIAKTEIIGMFDDVFGANMMLKKEFRDKFQDECILMSQMHHPNIVQFIGVHYNRENRLSLIMEYLPMSIDTCIKHCNTEHFKLPLCFKLSILRDVTCGLLYLHNLSIIHRDLTANDIMLTSNLRAKIADLGASRKITPAETKGSKRLTMCPGALYIMPPEALKQDCQYDYKLDIFSFGILSLYVILQESIDPDTSNDTTTSQYAANKEVEIGKRMKFIEKVPSVCDGFLYLIRACLQDVPDRRPTTLELKQGLEHLCEAHPNQYGDTIQMLQTIGLPKYRS